MFLSSELAEAQPLIVCGLPRCGTGFVRTAYNAQPHIHLQGELHPPALELAADYLRATEAAFDRLADTPRTIRTRGWQAHKRELAYAMWITLSKTPVHSFSDPVRWFGHKTPRADRHWSLYREILGDDVRYVFCLRRFADFYRSSYALKPKPIEEAAESYRSSIQRYMEMKSALGDNVSLFTLEQLREGGEDFLRLALFERLGIEYDETALTGMDPAKRVNDTEGAQRRKRPLTPDEGRFLKANPDLDGLLEQARMKESRQLQRDQVATDR